MKMLVAAGVAAAAARDMAEQAALAQSNQAAQLANLRAEYDYIVVGARRRGLRHGAPPVAERPASVLVIEGGGTNLDQEKIYNPGIYTRNFGSDTDWGYKSTPQKALNNRVIVAPVGKIIGGGSSINATVWLKGDKADYDAWEAAAGPGWGYDAIIRNFKKAERYAGGETAIRGGAGMIATRKPAMAHPVTHAFVDSAVGLGKAEHMDINNVAERARRRRPAGHQRRRQHAAHLGGACLSAAGAVAQQPDAAAGHDGDQARHQRRPMPRRGGDGRWRRSGALRRRARSWSAPAV